MRCVGIFDVDVEAHGALTGAVSGFFRPEVDFSLDLVRIAAADAVDLRPQVAQLRQALLPASVDVFDLREGRDWVSADDFLIKRADRSGNGHGKLRVVVAPGGIDRLDEILARRAETQGVFLTGLGPWRDVFGGDLCMQLTKRWIGLDDPTFRLEPMSTFANFATVGKIDRTWVEWLLFDRAREGGAAEGEGAVIPVNLAEGLPIGRDRVAAYLDTLKRLLRS